MASREVKNQIDNLKEVLDRADSRMEDDAREIVSQIAAVTMQETGLQELNVIMPLLAEGSGSLVGTVQDLAGTTKSDTIQDVLDFLCKLVETVRTQGIAPESVLMQLTSLWEFADGINMIPGSGAKMRTLAVGLLSHVFSLSTSGDQLERLDVPKMVKWMVNDCKTNNKKLPTTLKQIVYGFLGEIARHKPTEIGNIADDLFHIFLNDLQAEINKSQKSEFPTIAGCLDGLSGLLYHFANNERCVKSMNVIITSCRKVIHVRELARYAMIFSALKLFSQHADVLSSFFLTQKDAYVEIYNDLTFWATHPANREAQKLGYRALDDYLRECGRILVVNSKQKIHRETAELAYDFFAKEFDKKITESRDSRSLTLAVRGYGYFAAATTAFSSPEAAGRMFTEMIYKSEQMFFTSSSESTEDKLTNLPSFIESLAIMVKDSDSGLPDTFQPAVQRLCILLMDVFPRLSGPQQHFGCKSLVKLFIIASRSSAYGGDFISEIIYQGLVRSCSYPVPVENLEEEYGATRKPTNYKDFFPLWEKLVNCDYMKDLLTELGISEMDLLGTAKLIFDDFLSAVVRIMDSLNLQLLSTLPEEESITVDVIAVDKAPSKEQDFQIFFSLEQIVKNIMEKVKSDIGLSRNSEINYNIMNISDRRPLVSGLYRLLSVFWNYDRRAKKSSELADSDLDLDGDVAMEDEIIPISAQSDHVTASFVQKVIGRLQHFFGDLLVSALGCVLDAPEKALIEILDERNMILGQPLLLALQTAKSDLYFAESVVKTLSRWCIDKTIPLYLLQPHFPSVIPQLDSFLRGHTVEVRERSKVVQTVSKSSKAKKALDLDETVLDRVRLSVLEFLGALGGKFSHFVLGDDRPEQAENLGITWDMEKHMKFTFPFADIILNDFFLDDLLPRVIDLALHSPDRKTKIAACETLHAMTICLVGNHAFMTRDKSSLFNVIRKLMPRLLELSCDAEPVAKQLFEPLLLQLVHWYSRKAAIATNESAAVLDSIMEGLVSERNPVVRDFSARCAQEYLEWSLKETKAGEMSAATHSLLEKIVSFASHSSAARRFGAGLTFSRCYRIFRESPVAVDMFTIDLIVTFMKSLAASHRDNMGIGTGKLIEGCLDHLARIAEKYVKKLQKASQKRRKPADLEEATLEYLVNWLLLQACRPETDCRIKSWMLLERLIKASRSSVTAAPYFDDLIKSNGLSWLLRMFLNGGFPPAEEGHLLTVEAVQNGLNTPRNCLHTCERLGAAVDCVAWALREVYIKPESAAKLAEWTDLFRMTAAFITFISDRSSPGEPEDSTLQRTKCTLLIRITDLLIYLLKKHGKEGRNSIPVTLWSQHFFYVIAMFALDPGSLGFDLLDPEVQSGLLLQLRSLLQTLSGSLDPETMKSLSEAVGKVMSKPQYDVISLAERDAVISNFLLESYSILRQSGLDSHFLEAGKSSPEKFGRRLLNMIENRLTKAFRASGSRLDSWLRTSVSKEQQLFFLALNYIADIREILNKYIVHVTDREVFYPKLKRSFFKYIFATTGNNAAVQGKFLEMIFQHKQMQIADEILRDCLEYIIGHRTIRKQYGAIFCPMVVQYFGTFLESFSKITDSIEGYRIPLENLKLLLLIDSGILKSSSAEISKIISFYVSVLTHEVGSDQSVVSVKNYALRLLPFFLSSSDSANVEDAIQQMYINDFPVTAAEIAKDRTRTAYYLQSLDLLLNAVALNDNRVLLEICVKIICRDQHNPLVDRFDKMFESICANDRGGHTQDILDIPWRIFVNVQYAIEHREIAVDRVLLPMIRSTSQSALMGFFSRHIDKMCEIVETKQRIPTLGLTVEMKCCFELVELFCARMPKVDLFSSTSAATVSYAKYRSETDGKAMIAPTGKEFVQFITRSADGITHENIVVEPEMKEARRQLHCAAYKALAAAVTATQIELKFYHMCLFEEKPEKGRVLWSNLVDTEKVYEFPVEFIRAPEKKEQLAAIHKEVMDETDLDTPLSLSGLFTMTSYASVRASAASLIQASSLGEELSRFDYSNGMDRTTIPLTVLEQHAARKSKELVVLELTDLNLNECMATLVALIQMMAEKGISPRNGVPPNWVLALKQELKNPVGHLNVKLFIAKLIVNVENSRQPYFTGFADAFYAPLADLITKIPCPEGSNYFVVDLVQTMLKWTVTSSPQTLEQSAAQNLFVFILKNVRHTNSQVQKNNATLLYVLARAWRNLLTCPGKNVLGNLLTNDPSQAKSNNVVITIISVILETKVPLTTAAFEEYSKILILHMKTPSIPVYRASAVVFGLLVSRALEVNIERTKIDGVLMEVEDKLESLSSDKNTKTRIASQQQFMIMLQHIVKAYPPIVTRHVRRILNIFPQVSGANNKASCLEILNQSAFENPFAEFKEAKVQKCLADRNENVQGLAVQLYKKMSPRFTTRECIELLGWMQTLFSHHSEILRQQVYDFCMQIYERFENASTLDETSVMQAARLHLIAGLTDKDRTIRNNLFAFWTQERRFSGSTFARLMIIFRNFLEPELQSAFLSSACHLLLELSAKTPQFGLPVFPQSLSDCEYFKQEIETTWRSRSSMMPMTASTYASGTFSGTFGSARVGQRAPVFTPTQLESASAMDSLVSSAMHTYASQFSESLMVDMPLRDLFGGAGDAAESAVSQDDLNRYEQEQTQKDLNNIRRRIQRDRQDDRQFFAQRAIMKQKQREEGIKKERERRELDVRLSRMYRIGEVPDVMITHSAIIQPLQTLTELDPQTAGLLLVRLFQGIIQESKKKRDIVDSDLNKLVEKMEKILSSEHVSDVTFLTSMLNVVVSEETRLLGSVSPRSIGSAAVKSQQPHLGIAVLETALLKQTTEPSSKRGAQKTQDSWLSIFKLLQNAGDTDSIRGVKLEDIFHHSDNVGQALDAEIRGDVNGATILYAALHEAEEESEQNLQLLKESYMRCLSTLANWNELEKVAVPEALNGMEKMWDDPYLHNVMLPYAIQSQLKLALENNSDAHNRLQYFFDEAVANSQRNNLLERRYAFPAAIFCLLEKRIARAHYYLKLASRSLLDNWAGTPQLNLHSRRIYLPFMQFLQEAKGDADLLTKCQLYPDKAPLLKENFVQLLAEENRNPSEMDSVGIWNDLISNRRFFVNSMDQPNAVSKTFDVHECLKVAAVAVRQHNFRISDQVFKVTQPLLKDIGESTCYASPDSPLKRIRDRWDAVYISAALERSSFHRTSTEAERNLPKLFDALRLAEKTVSKANSGSKAQLIITVCQIRSAIVSILSEFADTVNLDVGRKSALGLQGNDATKLYPHIFTAMVAASRELADHSSSTESLLEEFRFCDNLVGKDIVPDLELVQSGTSALLRAVKLS